MHDQHPGPGGTPKRPEGNRPANNARIATPGSVGSGGLQSDENAEDFLGLEAELAGETSPPTPGELMAHPPPAAQEPAQPAAQEPAALVEEWTGDAGQEAVVLAEDDAFDDEPGGPERSETYEDEGESGQVLTDWREEEPDSKGNRKLVAVAAGVAVVGMLGVAAVKLVGASSTTEEIAPEPLAAYENPLPLSGRDMTTPVTGEAPLVVPERTSFDEAGNAVALEPRAGIEPAGGDPTEDARSAFEAVRGDQPPAWFDPALDTSPQPTGFEPDPVSEPAPQPPAWSELGAPGVGQAAAGEATVEVADAGGAGESATGSEPASTAGPIAAGSAASAEAGSASESTPGIEEPGELLAEAGGEAAAGQPESGSELTGPEPTGPELLAEAGGEATAGEPAGQTAEPGPELVAESGTEPPAGEAASAPGAIAASDPVQVGAPTSGANGGAAMQFPWFDMSSLRGSKPPAPSPELQAPPVASAGAVEPNEPAVAAGDPSRVGPSPVEEPVQVASVLGPPLPPSGLPQERPAAISALEAHAASRQTRTSAIDVDAVLLAPAMDSGALNRASGKDMAAVWQEKSVPHEGIGNKTKVLTPNVGRVRVILRSNDVFEGRLYAVGEGSVWIDTQYGRMALGGERIGEIQHLDSAEDTPALGQTGSQDLAGMARVRVNTPGGAFYGKVIARNESKTTVITDDGARLTLDSKDVELLIDAPKVTIKGRAPKEGDEPAPRKP